MTLKELINGLTAYSLTLVRDVPVLLDGKEIESVSLDCKNDSSPDFKLNVRIKTKTARRAKK